MLPPSASLVRLELRVRDLARCLSFYTDVLGLEVVGDEDGRTSLAPAGRLFSIDLLHDPGAPLRPYPCVGLYHFALLVPDRGALGAIFRRLVDLEVRLEGMADHGVSESLYLRDPEHNGIELYRDRAREDWPADPDGLFAMVSDPLDVEGVLGAAEGPAPLDAQTRFGHIHLHVPSLEGAERFFTGTLGLSVTQRTYSGALFFAAGDYHHHVGTNTWAPDRQVPEGATGLVGYEWRVPDGPTEAAGEIRDPTGAEVRLVPGRR